MFGIGKKQQSALPPDAYVDYPVESNSSGGIFGMIVSIGAHPLKIFAVACAGVIIMHTSQGGKVELPFGDSLSGAGAGAEKLVEDISNTAESSFKKLMPK